MPLFYTCGTSYDHSHSPAAEGDSRSPCPALNTLANHGYLPRNGRGITIFQLVHALTEVYNISTPLAFLLSLVGVFKCGSRWSVDLHELAKHNAIEHDGSLTHADAPPDSIFAPTNVDSSLVDQLLSVTTCDHLTLQDFAKARADRDVAIRTPLDKFHAEISRGECVLTVKVFGTKCLSGGAEHDDQERHEDGVSKTFITQWFVQEKLPDGWKKPSQPVGLIDAALGSRKVEAMIHALHSTS